MTCRAPFEHQQLLYRSYCFKYLPFFTKITTFSPKSFWAARVGCAVRMRKRASDLHEPFGDIQ